MKLLCLSDLHQRMNDISDVIHHKRFTPFLQSIRDVVEDTTPDVIVVTGGYCADAIRVDGSIAELVTSRPILLLWLCDLLKQKSSTL